jgi:TolA-binding protein
MAEEIASTSATPASIAQPPGPTVSSATATTQQTVTIPLEQAQAFTTMQARLAQLESEQRSREQAIQQEQARIRVQKGEVEDAMRILREQSEQQVQAERARLAQVEERAKRYALDGELSRALAACNLVPGGAEQLTQLWRNQFLVDSQGDSFAVRTPTFQSVGDFVHQQLGRPEYAHFVRPQNPGGGTGGFQPSTQSLPSTPANPAQAPQPKNMGEAVILHMQNMQKAQGDPRANISLPMGLKAVR